MLRLKEVTLSLSAAMARYTRVLNMAQRWLVFAVTKAAALWVGLAAVSAHAQSTCDIDADCDFGFSCQVIGSGGECTAIPCVEGEDCPQPRCPEPQDIKACEPLRDCQGDAQCAQGFVCHTETYENCVTIDIACDPSGNCPMPEPAACDPVTETYCTPRWTLPCAADADCGSGFSCLEQQSCWCSGSTGTAGAGGAAGGGDLMAPVPELDAGVSEPDCGCSPSGTFYCELQELPCESDADCESGLTCQEDLFSGTCAMTSPPTMGSDPVAVGGGMGTSDAQDAGAADSSDGGSETPRVDVSSTDCPPPTKRCAPPDYFYGSGSIARGDVAADSPLAVGGEGSNMGGNMGSDTGALPPQASQNAAQTAAGTGGPDHVGCSVTRSGLGFGQLAFVALALATLRRRRK